MTTLKLGTIEEELAAGRKAFEGIGAWAVVMHYHHDRWLEIITVSPRCRIETILKAKDESEQPLRLRLFRPYHGPFSPVLEKAGAVWREAWRELNACGSAWEKGWAAWEAARVVWEEARVGQERACAEWEKENPDAHAKFCTPGCPWNGKTIFG